MAKDFYNILGVDKGASQEEIRKAYKKMAMKYHPDRNQGDDAAEAKFKEAAEAYDILGDEQKRRTYDQYGEAGLGGMGGSHDFSNFEDIFSAFGDVFGQQGGGGGGGSIFESFFGGGGRRGPRQGASLKCAVNITFEEAVFGCEKTIELRRSELCNTCDGSGAKPGSQPVTCPYCQGTGQIHQTQGFFSVKTTCHKCGGGGKLIQDACKGCNGNGREVKTVSIKINIPAGVDNDTRMRVAGEGEPGELGGPRGDLYCYIQVEDHQIFQRHDDDIHCNIPIHYTQAALGSEIEVPTISGLGKLKIPAGTQSGQSFRMKAQGVPNVQGYGRGDQIVTVNVETPKKLSKEQRQLLEQLAELEHAQTESGHKGFMDKIKELFD